MAFERLNRIRLAHFRECAICRCEENHPHRLHHDADDGCIRFLPGYGGGRSQEDYRDQRYYRNGGYYKKSMEKKFVKDPDLKATKQPARLVSEVARDEPKPLQAGGSVKKAGERMRSLKTDRLPVESDHRLVGAVEGNHPERECGGFGHDPETALVRGIMVKKVYYCFEHQSADEAREIMCEHNLQYLPVVDEDMRVMGMVALRDLAAIEQQQRNR
jgi:CBS domain-containing protein